MRHVTENARIPQGREGLSGWCYTNPELYALECDTLFRNHWQLACHVSDVAETGDFVTFDLVGERALIVRGRDGVVRAFHNLCRHRASRVVAGEQGSCPGVITCPFHAWTYELDGRLRSAAQPRSFPKLDKDEWGLKPLEMEIWHGFVFVRFQPGPQPAVAEILARFEQDVVPHDMENLVAVEGGLGSMESAPVNWKSVRDVDNEGYHVPMAHPGLQDLYGKDYTDEAMQGGTSRSIGIIGDEPSRLWSVRHYKKMLSLLPEPWASLPRQWTYFGMFPNTVIACYPDSVIFYQDIPLGVGETAVRGGIYARPNEDRTTRLARKLSMRIDNLTAEEDKMLTVWAQEAIQSSAFDGIILSDLEAGVRCYHDLLRQTLPVMGLAHPPEEGSLARVNADLAGNGSIGAMF